jgi:hypothetical protein
VKIKTHRVIILPFVLSWWETSCRTLREERKVRVSENRVLMRIYDPRREYVTGDGGYTNSFTVLLAKYLQDN